MTAAVQRPLQAQDGAGRCSGGSCAAAAPREPLGRQPGPPPPPRRGAHAARTAQRPQSRAALRPRPPPSALRTRPSWAAQPPIVCHAMHSQRSCSCRSCARLECDGVSGGTAAQLGAHGSRCLSARSLTPPSAPSPSAVCFGPPPARAHLVLPASPRCRCWPRRRLVHHHSPLPAASPVLPSPFSSSTSCSLLTHSRLTTRLILGPAWHTVLHSLRHVFARRRATPGAA
jgi:hypothetical protein